MTSIFQRALGPDFDRLHPRIQERFGFASRDGICHLGHGVMDRVWHGPAWTSPFLRLGARRHVLFPEQGDRVPFTIANEAEVDGDGNEVVTFLRRFDLGARVRCFDAWMRWDEAQGCIVDELGTGRRLAVDLHLWVDEDGGMNLRSGEYRFAGRSLRTRVPDLVTGRATVREHYDEATDRFRISVAVVNDTFGPLFGYEGRFTVEVLPSPGAGTPSQRVRAGA